MEDDLLQESRRRGIVSSRVLRVDSHFDCMPPRFLTRLGHVFQLVSIEASLACQLCVRLAKHKLHKVNSVNHLGDPMFHLQSGVHLEKEKGAALVIDQELKCPCTRILDRLGQRYGSSTEFSPKVWPPLRHERAGTLLNHLLVPALDAALPLTESRDLALAVSKDLHLDVVGSRVVPLQEDPRVLKQRRPAGLYRLKRLSKLALVLTGLQPHPAAAGGRLEHHGVPQALRGPRGIVGAPQKALRSRNDGHTGRQGEVPCRVLEAELLDAVRRRSDKVQARGGGRAGEAGILGEKPVPRDDGLRAGILGFFDDLVAVEVGPGGVPVKEVGRVCVSDVLRC